MSESDAARILVVDDEPELRELLTDALSATDLRVSAAASGTEALTLAEQSKPDLLVMDLFLENCNGLDVIDDLRAELGDIPVIVITGRATPAVLADASRRRPVELMTKPLDLDRLRGVIREELSHQADRRRTRGRSRRLRSLARAINIERKEAHHKLETTCAELTNAYRSLSGQLNQQQLIIEYLQQLLLADSDDDVFRNLFRLFVQRSGPVFGIAMVCNADADLQIVGRFGVPQPDSLRFCHALSQPLVNYVLSDPQCLLIDAGEQAEMFSPTIQKYLAGLTALTIPLIPTEGEIIGVAILYRKGEQPFIDADIALAEIVASPTGACVKKNN